MKQSTIFLIFILVLIAFAQPLIVSYYLIHNQTLARPTGSLEVGKQLGSGAFGYVHDGYWTTGKEGKTRTRVAVKYANETAKAVKTLSSELGVLRQLKQCKQIVNLVAFLEKPRLTIILEFCPYGDLAAFLRNNDFVNKIPNAIAIFLDWLYQISSGMVKLAAQNLVHCDLALRNVLLAENNIVKICDFGLSKFVPDESTFYYASANSPVPMESALECFTDRKFSEFSDVWSFGVLSWQMFSFGAHPYKGVFKFDTIQALMRGDRMSKPTYASDRMYEIMLSCWNATPEKRPRFSTISEDILRLSEKRMSFQKKLTQTLKN